MGCCYSCLNGDVEPSDIIIYDRVLLPNYSLKCLALAKCNVDFLNKIIQWRTEWFDDDNKKKPKYSSILHPEYPLKKNSEAYNTWDDYRKTMEPLMVLEFYQNLLEDKDDDDTENEITKPRTLRGDVNHCRTKKLDGKKFTELTIKKITQNHIEYNFPRIGDLLIVKFENQIETFGYLENIKKYTLKPGSNVEWCFTILIEDLDIPLNQEIALNSKKSLYVYLKMLQALHDLSASPYVSLILQPSHTGYNICKAPIKTVDPLIFDNKRLNDTQLQIVARVVETVDSLGPHICLVQGPPGSGKSTVIISIISELIKKKNGTKILLCAQSNQAVDAVLLKLLDVKNVLKQKGVELKIVRIGRDDKMDPGVNNVTLSTLSSSQQISKSLLLTKKTAGQHRIEEQILANADIIVSTLSSCYTYKMEKIFGENGDKKIPVCIVDEAGQSTEVSTLVPLMLGVKTLVLVGDPQQLPPTIISEKAKAQGMDISLFTRVQKYFQSRPFLTDPILMINRQYRMAKQIASWPNRQFYSGRIENAAEITSLLTLHHYRVLSHNSLQNQAAKQNENIAEATIIVNLLVTIINEFMKVKTVQKIPSIGVITPYCHQKTAIEKIIQTKCSDAGHANTLYIRLNKIVVNTLDSFQGKEEDIIIMSCVRTEKIGFFNDPHRLNVGLTRAKYTMIICGNFNPYSPFRKNTMWRSLLEDAERRNCYRHNVDENMSSVMLRKLIFH